MDVFSNILFVKEHVAALSQLAHRAVATEKYSPDTCCIVGNYYSLKVSRTTQQTPPVSAADSADAPCRHC